MTFAFSFLDGWFLRGALDEIGRLRFLRLVRDAGPKAPDNPPAWWEAFTEDMARYVQGEPVDFRFVPLAWEEVTPYARTVLSLLRDHAGWGEVLTYGDLAHLAGGSPRSVGQVMRRNPWVIVVPCHRVVAARGPGGYAYGTDVKGLLLELERGTPARTGRLS